MNVSFAQQIVFDFERFKSETPLIGKGSGGSVYKVNHNHKAMALKIVTLCTTGDQNKIENELILQKICHPNIIQYHLHFYYQNNAFILLELCHSDSLYDHLVKEKKFPDQKIASFVLQISSALEYLHNNLLIHRDIKLENILLTQDLSTVKLCDFGFCVQLLKHPETQKIMKCRDQCGSMQYVAPEILLGHDYDFSVDMWSFGIVIFSMFHGYLPFSRFQNCSRSKFVQHILSLDCKFSELITPLFRQFILSFLAISPICRIQAPNVKSHSWLTSFFQKAH